MSTLLKDELWNSTTTTSNPIENNFEAEVAEFEAEMSEQEADEFLAFMEVHTNQKTTETAGADYILVPFSQKTKLLKKLKKYGYHKPEHRGNGLVRKGKEGYWVKISRLNQTQLEVIQRIAEGSEEQ